MFINRGLFNNSFPYTDLHNLNADWLLSTMRTLYEEYLTIPDDIQKAVDELEKKMDIKIGKVLAEYDKKISAIIEEIAQTAKDLEEFANELEARLDKELAENQKWVKEQIDKLTLYVNNEIVTVLGRLEELNTTLRAYTDMRIQQVIDMIPELQNVQVINPLTGELETLQKVLNEMYNFLNEYLYTAGEWDALNLSASEFDSLNMTAFVIDNEPRKIIENALRKCFNMYSPFSGDWTDARNVIVEIVDYLQMPVSWSAGEIDFKDLTAEVFDTANISAYDLDWTKWTA